MKIINYLSIIFISLLAVSCTKIIDPVKKIGLGSRVVNYQADDKIESLVIPPDLTTPRSQSIFSEIIQSDDVGMVSRINNVQVKRDNYHRWLVIDMPPNKVWSLAKEFFRSYGFTIEKENQQIGMFETDYLEAETNVPERSLGVFRAALAKALKTQYGLPTADKYRVRIESIDDLNSTEVYFNLSSIGEVVSGEMRLWQPREKDVELETEMLLKLMIFLGADKTEAITNIQDQREVEDSYIETVELENGFVSLVFPYDREKTWKLLGWSLDELAVEVEDRDSSGGSFFIKVSPNKSFFSKLIDTIGSVKSYQLYIKQINNSRSEVFFIDLSEENDKDALSYNIELFNQIASKF